ncbi:putative multidrug export ATP-binding/permease protein [Betaproteobacteria bacterium MOLA814]|nr:putative multidrug export ATP-binding/permease protein [Betaproteobacteria bacterium MOLA814]
MTTPTPTKTQGLLSLSPFIKPYRWQVGFALLMLLAAAAATLVFPTALRKLIDGGLSSTSGNNPQDIAWYFAMLFGVAVALALFSGARFFMVSWLGERITADIRQAVYARVLNQSPQFFEQTPTGDVLSRLSADTTLVQTVVGSSLSMGLRNAVMGLGALGMLVWHHPLMMAQVCVGLLLVIAPSMWMGRRVRRLSRDSQDRVADASALASEVLNAITVVQSYTAQGREASRFEHSTNAAFRSAIRRSTARSALVTFVMVTTSAALLWGLYMGTLAVLAGTLSPGELGQTVLYVIILAGAFAVLGEVSGDLLRAAGASERLIELLHMPSHIQEATHTQPLKPSHQGLDVQLINVQFAYPSRLEMPALHGINLHIKAGTTVALVGASGAGKTTIMQLLQRFYDTQDGSILLQGTSIKTLALTDLRTHVGVVPQEPVVFAASALDNIRYGRPDATNDEVVAAAKAAYAHDFIMALPMGYETFMGERGVRLSGGQRQRLAIARAMLKNAPLLLLDEATSALDTHSEQMVQAALDRAMQGRTTIVVAHRLSTVQRADSIVVIAGGHIVEQGKHHELLAHNGAYAALAQAQFGQEAPAVEPALT